MDCWKGGICFVEGEVGREVIILWAPGEAGGKVVVKKYEGNGARVGVIKVAVGLAVAGAVAVDFIDS